MVNGKPLLFPFHWLKTMFNSKENQENQSAKLNDAFPKFRSALERLVRRFAGQDNVDDIVGETYLRTLEHFGDEEEIEYPKAFLLKTARNLALNYISKHENRYTQSVEDFSGIDVYLMSEKLESQIEAQEKFRLFCDVAERLTPKCRKAFVLKRVYGWSLKAIAEEMDISPSTVEKHVAKGLLLCTRELKAKGYDLQGIANTAQKENLAERKFGAKKKLVEKRN